MSREEQVATLMRADAQLMSILTGGVWTSEDIRGVEGIRRGDDSPTAAAFDADGFLLPCALVREDDLVPYSGIRSPGMELVGQVIFIHFYQMRGHEVIDLAKERNKIVLDQQRLGRSYPIWWLTDSLPVPDSGPLQNSTTISQIWQVVSTQVRPNAS